MGTIATDESSCGAGSPFLYGLDWVERRNAADAAGHYWWWWWLCGLGGDGNGDGYDLRSEQLSEQALQSGLRYPPSFRLRHLIRAFRIIHVDVLREVCAVRLVC